MKLQSDWLIQMTEKIRGPDSRDEYEELDWPAGKMNIDSTYMYMIIERGGKSLLELTLVGREKVNFE